MNDKYEKFYEELKIAVETDKLHLPTLPEVALKIRDAVEGENATAQDIAELLTQDASLSVRLIQLANSPLYRSRHVIDSLQQAVTCLGTRLVRDLIVSLAMKQIYQATTDALDDQFRNAWSIATDVAAICRIMSTISSGVDSEQALLSGLIHNVGALPILVLAEEDDVYQDATELHNLIYALQGSVGELVLKSWNFPDHMVEVVKECRNFDYEREGESAAIDLVQVALLQGGYVDDLTPEDWPSVPAFRRLGMDTEINVVDIEDNRAEIESTKESLMA